MFRRLPTMLRYLFVAAATLLCAASAIHLLRRPEPVQAQATTGTWFFSTTTSVTPTCGRCDFSLPVSGYGTFGSLNNNANDVLSPSVPFTIKNLSVQIDAAPGSGSLTFVLGTDTTHNIRCVVSGTSPSCNSGSQQTTIPPRSKLQLAVSNSGGAPATRVRISWFGTP